MTNPTIRSNPLHYMKCSLQTLTPHKDIPPKRQNRPKHPNAQHPPPQVTPYFYALEKQQNSTLLTQPVNLAPTTPSHSQETSHLYGGQHPLEQNATTRTQIHPPSPSSTSRFIYNTTPKMQPTAATPWKEHPTTHPRPQRHTTHPQLRFNPFAIYTTSPSHPQKIPGTLSQLSAMTLTLPKIPQEELDHGHAPWSSASDGSTSDPNNPSSSESWLIANAPPPPTLPYEKNTVPNTATSSLPLSGMTLSTITNQTLTSGQIPQNLPHQQSSRACAVFKHLPLNTLTSTSQRLLTSHSLTA